LLYPFVILRDEGSHEVMSAFNSETPRKLGVTEGVLSVSPLPLSRKSPFQLVLFEGRLTRPPGLIQLNRLL